MGLLQVLGFRFPKSQMSNVMEGFGLLGLAWALCFFFPCPSQETRTVPFSSVVALAAHRLRRPATASD